jgi:hypothetical protein
MAASARAVTLCTFNPGRPIDHANPHVGIYTPAGLKVVGKAKTMPKACKAVLKWKKDFWRQHPFFKIPRALK